MNLNDAQIILGKYNTDAFHLHHAKVVSGVMSYFATEYDPGNEEYWAIVGLLHDIDFGQFPDEHCVKGHELLTAEGVPNSIIRSAMSHGWGMTGSAYEPTHIMENPLRHR